MCSNNQSKVEPTTQDQPATTDTYKCGFCGSTKPYVPAVEMYGPGAEDMYDCCPDCGGV